MCKCGSSDHPVGRRDMNIKGFYILSGQLSTEAELDLLREELAQARLSEAELRAQVAVLTAQLDMARISGLASQQDRRLDWGRLRRKISRNLKRSAGRLLGKLPSPSSGGPGVPVLRIDKDTFREQARQELESFLDSEERLVFYGGETPDISILLVLYNQAPLTYRCLRSIMEHAAPLQVRVVIADNASSDETSRLLDRIDGAVILRNKDNLHFLRGVNLAADHAAGPGLLLLNNDAMLRPGTLQAAWNALNAAPDIGAVGGPIILPDGTLQEAGSIIWSDGTCLGYGRGRSPLEAEFQFRRDVDYCSGAFLLVRRKVFEALGRLDTAFAPAYYEETDFCMRLREAGYRIVYEPDAAIDHFEFASATSSASALALQATNHERFRTRHQQILKREHHAPGTDPLFARARDSGKGRVLVIDDRVPFPSLGAGYPRAAELTLALVADGWSVTYYPLLTPNDSWDEIYTLFPWEVEVALNEGVDGLRRLIDKRDGYYDTIFVSRPHNMRLFLDHISARPSARLIYDAEAVFAQRSILQMTLEGHPPGAARRKEMLEAEMSMARLADRIVTVSPHEKILFTQGGCADVHVLGHAQAPAPTGNGFDQRSGYLFVGALDDDPSPNLDSLLWFASDVMPLLTRAMPENWTLQVAGRAGARRAKALQGPRIAILGRVEDLDALYETARVFIAPTRYAAGIPLKVCEAAARGVPVVATALLARQLGWTHEKELLVADNAEEFADACARLYRDQALWERLRQAALKRVEQEYSPDFFRNRVAEIMSPAIENHALRHVPDAWPAMASALVNTVAADGRQAPGRMAVARYQAYRALRLVRGARQYAVRHGLSKTVQRAWLEILKRVGKRNFSLWSQFYDTLDDNDMAAIHRHMANLVERPTFDVRMRWDGDEAALRACVTSLQEQAYQRWTMLLLSAPGASPLPEWWQALAREDSRFSSLLPTGKIRRRFYTVLLEPGDQLRSHALYLLAAEADQAPGAVMLYTDDEIAGAEVQPHFYPEWSEESLRDPCALDGLVAIRSDLLPDGDLLTGALWRHRVWAQAVAGSEPSEVSHIAHIAIQRRVRAAPDRSEWLDTLQAQCPAGAQIVDAPHGPRIVYPLPMQPPLVSIIIPTKDQAALVRQCVEGLLYRTDYPAIEVIIVDNGSVEPATARVLKALQDDDDRVSVLRDDGPFNYSALNNKAARLTKGEVIALVNNDIVVREPGWLREMVSQLLRPNVGVVGAKLLYGNGTVQHAGVITGLHGGVASHVFRQSPPDAEGYDRRLVRVQDMSCVTAACMVIRRDVFETVGGLDEKNLPVSYNDVDFCLRVKQAGWRVLWTPHAVLDHLESISRGEDTQKSNAERAHREYLYMLRQWEHVLGQDPAYNPNLSLQTEFTLSYPPRIRKPWYRYK
ncbi:Glycosyltransferase [Granulibacter bethesdensis]|nr:Glycosyltransferase [Granulibacter bethesdensis]